jgi:hypothetical protein
LPEISGAVRLLSRNPGERVGSNVAIVMATYNGGAHVPEQVRSLLAQDVREWRLLVRDDGSTDDTRERVESFAREDSRITLLPAGERLGPAGNFGALCEHAVRAGAEYVFPCDQDDVWNPTKMSLALGLMRRLESEHGKSTALLVHSDLEVVDASLAAIAPSFLRFQGIAHIPTEPLKVLLVQNFVTGCASLLNRALLDLALPLPPLAIMHDWWLALCAAAGGRIDFVDAATIQYRQHGANQIGAGGSGAPLNVLDSQERRRFARSWSAMAQAVLQARALHERMRERGRTSGEALDLVGEFAGLDRESPLRRLRTLRRLGIHCHRPLGTALVYLRLWSIPHGAA